MGKYIVQRDNFTPTAGQDVITIASASNRRVRIVEISVGGTASSASAQRLFVTKSTAGTTPGGALTPSNYDHDDQAAAGSSVYTTWSVQPSRNTHGELLNFNAFGGANRWVPTQEAAFEARNGACISIYAPSGSTPAGTSISVVFEEL